jgi:hypothetical protein
VQRKEGERPLHWPSRNMYPPSGSSFSAGIFQEFVRRPLGAPPPMKMASYRQMWNPIVGPLSPERRPVQTQEIAARRSAPTVKAIFTKVA